MRSVLIAAVSWLFLQSLPGTATANHCIAFAGSGPRIVPAALPAAQGPDEVAITYVGHSTFRIRTPQGVVAATDYAGFYGTGPVPDVVTMNQAHETHYTDFPDPAIEYVLRGWNPAGGPAEHYLTIGDLLVRNVPTDIRGFGGTAIPDGNSIFIFEVADLCIGHLGHLHHEPTPEQFARIGRLDVVFVPVDGGLTLDLPTMIEVLRELKSSLVLPMHYFGGASLKVFLAGMAAEYDVVIRDEPSTVVSLASLPRKPTVLVLPGF